MKKINYVKDVLVVLLGNFMVAISVAFFVLPNNTLTGGVAGVAVALKPLLPFIPSVWLINILMIGLYIVGAIFLGKAFALKSLISTFSYSFITNICDNFISQRHICHATHVGKYLLWVDFGNRFRFML